MKSRKKTQLSQYEILQVAKFLPENEKKSFLFEYKDSFDSYHGLEAMLNSCSKTGEKLSVAQQNRHLIENLANLVSVGYSIPKISVDQFIKDQENYWRANDMYQSAMVTDEAETCLTYGHQDPQPYGILASFLSMLDLLSKLVEEGESSLRGDYIERNREAIISKKFLVWVFEKLKDTDISLDVAEKNIHLLHTREDLKDVLGWLDTVDRCGFIDDVFTYWEENKVDYGYNINQLIDLMWDLPNKNEGYKLLCQFDSLIEAPDDLLKVLPKILQKDRPHYVERVMKRWAMEARKSEESSDESDMSSPSEEQSDEEESQSDEKREMKRPDSNRPVKKVKFDKNVAVMFADERKHRLIRLMNPSSVHQMTMRSRK